MTAITKVSRILQSTYNVQIFQQLEREEFNPFKFYAIVLNINFVIILSFLCYEINSVYKFIFLEKTAFFQFMFFLGLVVLVLVIKSLSNRILSFFTNDRKVLPDYDINSTLINQALGIFLFPWVVIIEFSRFNPLPFLSGALVMIAAGLLIKWYRGIVIGMIEERVGLLQIFSYFCGLEILPLFVLVKYTVETF